MPRDLKSFVIGILRRNSYKWPPRGAALRSARVGRGIYRCAKCKSMVTNEKKHLDHVKPVIDPLTGFVGFDTYIQRLFPGVDGWQVLCIWCHEKKTKKENKKR